MDIVIGKGYGIYSFGMTEEQVIKILGKPDKTYLLGNYSNENLNDPYYEYNDVQVIFRFEFQYNTSIENKGYRKLGWIEVKNREATIAGNLIWNHSQKKIISMFEKRLKIRCTIENYNSIESVCFDDHWLEFQFELGKLTSINIGVLLDRKENQIWEL